MKSTNSAQRYSQTKFNKIYIYFSSYFVEIRVINETMEQFFKNRAFMTMQTLFAALCSSDRKEKFEEKPHNNYKDKSSTGV